MDYLEYMGIVHRDLAARNVLGKNVCIKTDSTVCFCQIILCRYLFFLHFSHIMFYGVISGWPLTMVDKATIHFFTSLLIIIP